MKPNSSPRYLLPLCLASLTLNLIGPLPAQAQTSDSARGPNRYLIVVENSRSMKPRVANIVAAVSNLFELSLKDHLRPGDSFGVWNFRTNLQTGEFPLQKWSPESHRQVRDSILNFIAQRPYDRRADYDELLLGLDRVVNSSSWLSVFIVTSGEVPVQGTPFNEAINSTLQTWRDTQVEHRQPMLIMLRGINGQWTAHAIAPAPFLLELPPLPKPPPEVAKPKSAPKTAPPFEPTPQQPVKIMPPLIVSGRKDPATNAPPPLVEATPTNAVPATNAVAADAGPKTEDGGSKPEGTNTVVSKPLTVSSNAPGSTVDVPKMEERAPATNVVVETKPVVTNPPPVVAKPEKTDDPGPTTERTNAVVSKPPIVTSNAPAVDVERKTEEPAAVTNLVAQAEPAVTNAPGDAGKPEKSPTTNRKAVLVLAGLGFALVAMVVVWVLRRSRGTQHSSLITRGFERHDKP